MNRSGRRDASSRQRGRIERAISGCPERFARPLTLFLVASFALFLFGLVMIYSASSIMALTSKNFNNDTTFFVSRQLKYAAIGLVILVFLAKVDYHIWGVKLLPVFWVITLVLLLIVKFTSSGSDSYGATRWISIAGFRFQPSEFAKIVIVLTGANLAHAYFEDDSIPFKKFVWLSVVGIGLPLLLILIQPDKGTTMICAATLLVMVYLSGVPGKPLVMLAGVGVVFFFAYSMKDAYSRQRILTVLNPWSDPLVTGYQIIQGFYAFAAGGIFGVGIGASRQKYSYLPFAHNDFIFAVVGEECGLVGTLGVVAGFAVIFWAGMRISRNAPDLAGRLIAAGSVSMMVIQLFVNICGVLAIMPMTGKPVPFLSYGGSSIISTLMTVGVVTSVALHSRLEETESDRRREDFSLASRGRAPRSYEDSGMVGEAVPRSARPLGTPLTQSTPLTSSSARPRFQVYEGGSGNSVAQPRANHTDLQNRGRISEDAYGRRRIDLGPDAADRLRPKRNNSARQRRSDRRGR